MHKKFLFINEYRFLNGNMLKMIAAVSMVLDHIAVVVMKGYVSAKYAGIAEDTLLFWNEIYCVLRNIGRLAFPLFAFLAVEGFFHTKSRKRYLLRLLLLAIVSEIPYDLANYGVFFFGGKQNTVFTLFLGLLMLTVIVWLWQKQNGKQIGFIRKTGNVPSVFITGLQAGICALTAWAAYVAKTDYNWRGILLIAVFYFFYDYRGAAVIAGICVFSYSPWSLPAFALLLFYIGERGRLKMRWFYLFYPVHLLVLHACKCGWILL